jgi:hypothetical protein
MDFSSAVFYFEAPDFEGIESGKILGGNVKIFHFENCQLIKN